MIRGWPRKRKKTTGGIERRSVRNMRGRQVDHERKTGGSQTRPYERVGGWFDTALRKTTGRLTTNGWGKGV